MAQGTDGHVGNRHPPTLINVAYGTLQFWDGRVGEIGRLDSLERQALAPIQDPHEMGLDPSVAAQRLREDDEIRELFLRAFREEPTPDLIAKAIASFERTLLFGNAPFDRFRAGDEEALSHAARRGHDLFFWKATCSACHTGFNLTDNAFHPSVARGMSEDDEGRASVTRNPRDAGHFKTPTLRDVSRRSPYMHNGSLKTLEEVIDRYDRGGFDTGYWPSDNLEKIARLMSGDDEESQRFQRSAAPQLRAGFSLRLTTDEKRDLVEFLREGLTSQTVPSILNDTAAALPVSAN